MNPLKLFLKIKDGTIEMRGQCLDQHDVVQKEGQEMILEKVQMVGRQLRSTVMVTSLRRLTQILLLIVQMMFGRTGKTR